MGLEISPSDSCRGGRGPQRGVDGTGVGVPSPKAFLSHHGSCFPCLDYYSLFLCGSSVLLGALCEVGGPQWLALLGGDLPLRSWGFAFKGATLSLLPATVN